MYKFIKGAIKIWVGCIAVALVIVVIGGIFEFLAKWWWMILLISVLACSGYYYAVWNPKRKKIPSLNLRTLVQNGLAEESSTREDAKAFYKIHTLVRSFHTRVVGVTYPNDDGSSRQEVLSRCLRGEPVAFNWHTYNGNPACAVISEHGQIGYLGADLAADLYDEYGDDAYCLVAHISDITGGQNGEYYGCNLLLEIYERKHEMERRVSYD